MGVSSSLFSSISGLNTMGEAMSVLGDNVANVNTIAFKSSRASFQDVLSQSVSTAAGSAQVGRGVTLATVDGLFAQGSFESSSTPTDMAIGGQGFFMLRAGDNAEANMFSRAGQFRFDQEGNLVNPTGAFVQGWTLETSTGERQGTIGDIQIGKSTPPTPTNHIEVITNVDARVPNESNETTLYNAWDARNAASVNPSPPITAGNYNYTTAIKVFDTKGASHDVTVYFDRTTKDNQWEFLVTVNPAEDLRTLTDAEQVIYAPNERINYEDPKQKGAGALMYGTIDYNTGGAIDTINAWHVPPDGEVDPAQNTNRIFLDAAESYFSFPVNFTGDDTNLAIELSFGARYTGLQTPLPQILVSDNGAFANAGTSAYITKETLWNSVYDQNGNAMATAVLPAVDSFDVTGFNYSGDAVTFHYDVVGTNKVSDFLTQLGDEFDCTATIDSLGRLKLTDGSDGPSGFFISSFVANTLSGADPFGSQVNVNTSKQQIVSPGRALSSVGGPPITAASTWGAVFASAGGTAVPADGTFTFTGFRSDNIAVTDTFTVNTTQSPTDTVQDLLSWLETTFQASAQIDGAGRLVLTDWTASTSTHTSYLAISDITYGAGAPAIFGPAATDFSTILGDSIMDDSRQGITVSNDFEFEALSSTQYANSSTTIFQDQNGFASGFLQSVSVDTDGVITGAYSNGQVLQRAQVALATFNNLDGLFKEGGNIYTQTTKSGAPITGAPGTNGLGSIAPNALEQSNVDIGSEFVRLITTQRGFQANSKIITTVDEMLTDLINIKR